MDTAENKPEKTIEPFAPTFTPNPPQTMDPSVPPQKNSQHPRIHDSFVDSTKRDGKGRKKQ